LTAVCTLAHEVVAKDALAEISKSRVDKAGRRLRLNAEGELDLDSEELADERDIVRTFRSAHGEPLSAVAANLRYYVRQESDLMIIGRRLKRVPTIIDKLTRHPEMALSRMHDIGGCRAVLRNEDEVRAIADRLEKNWEMAHLPYDYITEPKEDGYRAIHLVVRRHGCRIEVQLRTVNQHRWAELIERVDRESPFLGLKTGRSLRLPREYYALGAELLELEERGQPIPPATLDRFRGLNRRIFGDEQEQETDGT
jgi:ppGpp synthetase/RelA/SpoT-type nucleotidyltranferase